MSPADPVRSMPEPSKTPQILVDEAQQQDDEKNFKPRSPKFWLVILSLHASIFLVGLDRLIIATAIPSITNQFHSIDDIGWYGSAYMLTAAIFFPLSGRLYQLFPTKWVYLLSIIVFEAGSALCGAALSSASFIVGRAIAGIGAAGVFSGSTVIMIPLVPLRRRPTFTAFFGISMGLTAVLGPLIGGSFTDNENLTWRWCFYVNLPIGGFVFAAILLFLHLDSIPCKQRSIFEKIKQFDPLGLLFFVPSMVCLTLALQWGGTAYAWSAPRIIGLLITFAVTFTVFLAIEVLTPATAMAPTRILCNRSVGGSMLFMLLGSGSMMAIIYYLSIWFQAAQDQSAEEAGIRTIPMMLSLVIFGIVAAVFTEKVGYYVPPILLGSVTCAVGAGMLSTLRPHAGANQWIGYQVIYGLGLGAGFQSSTLVPQTVLAKTDVPLGMGLIFFMQQLGGSIFISVGQNIFSSKLVDSLSGIAGLDTATILNTGATALHRTVPANQLERVINAYSYALTRVFVMSAVLSALTLVGTMLIEWKDIKGRRGDIQEEITAGAGEKNGDVAR